MEPIKLLTVGSKTPWYDHPTHKRPRRIHGPKPGEVVTATRVLIQDGQVNYFLLEYPPEHPLQAFQGCFFVPVHLIPDESLSELQNFIKTEYHEKYVVNVNGFDFSAAERQQLQSIRHRSRSNSQRAEA